MQACVTLHIRHWTVHFQQVWNCINIKAETRGMFNKLPQGFSCNILKITKHHVLTADREHLSESPRAWEQDPDPNTKKYKIKVSLELKNITDENNVYLRISDTGLHNGHTCICIKTSQYTVKWIFILRTTKDLV